MKAGPRALIVVNHDWFFVSHRLGVGKALRDAGFDVTVAALPSAARSVIESEGLGFEALPFEPGGRSPPREAHTLWAIERLYRRHRPDVVHHVTIKPVLYGSTVARALGVPAIVNAVSGLGYVFIERPGDGLAQVALRRGVRAAYRVALGGRRTTTIFQNPDDRAMFVDGGLVRVERTALIRGSGVDTARFTPSPLPEGPPLVVMPARMLWDKGVGEVVGAARRVRRVMPEVKFALVGGADSENPATVPEATLRAWDDEGVVSWWGHRRDMPSVFARAHLVVLPSYREGMPLALAEAAACARASIATDVPGCREVVRDGENGWLVAPRDEAMLADAIVAALGDRGELARRGVAGRALVEREFSLDSVVARTLDVYRDLLGVRFPSARSR